ENAMVRWRIDSDLAGRGIDADPRLKGFDDLHPVDAASLLDRFRPQPESLIGPHRKLGDVRIIGAEALEKTRYELLVDGILQVLEIVVTDQHAVAFVGRQHDVLVADRERGRSHRNALAHAGGR